MMHGRAGARSGGRAGTQAFHRTATFFSAGRRPPSGDNGPSRDGLPSSILPGAGPPDENSKGKFHWRALGWGARGSAWRRGDRPVPGGGRAAFTESFGGE